MSTNETKTDINGSKGYPKNSFERFGDDLSELILSFLPIGDKFRFECLSTQWQRLVFGKVYDLRVQYDKYCDKFLIWTNCERLDEYLDYYNIEKVFQKLNNLSKVSIYGFVDPKQWLLTAIADNCPNLQDLVLNNNYSEVELSVDRLTYLGQKCGQNMVSVKVNQYYSKQHIRQLLSFTPNLKSIDVTNLSTILTEAKVWTEMKENSKPIKFLPKLRRVVFEYFDRNDLKQFVEEYKDSVVEIQTTSDANDLIKKLHYFHRLETLKVAVINDPMSGNNIFNSLVQMATNCVRLKRFVFSGTNLPPSNVFGVIGKLKQLNYLDIRLYHHARSDIDHVFKYGSVQDFGLLSHLKRLTLFMDHLSDDTLKNIDRYLPNLVSIRFYSESYITDKTLQFLSNIKSLQKLHIVCDSVPNVNTISDSGVKQLLRDCRHLRELDLYSCRYIDGDHKYRDKKFDITKDSVKAFVERAEQKPTIRLKFNYDWGRDWSEINELKTNRQLAHNLCLE